MTTIAPNKVAAFIVVFSVIAIFINSTRQHSLQSSGTQPVVAITHQPQPIIQQSPIVITNTIYLNQDDWTKIDVQNAQNIGWSAIHRDFALDMLINGNLYQQPPRDDPNWRPLSGIPMSSLWFRVTPGTPVKTGDISLEMTYNNISDIRPQETVPPLKNIYISIPSKESLQLFQSGQAEVVEQDTIPAHGSFVGSLVPGYSFSYRFDRWQNVEVLYNGKPAAEFTDFQNTKTMTFLSTEDHPVVVTFTIDAAPRTPVNSDNNTQRQSAGKPDYDTVKVTKTLGNLTVGLQSLRIVDGGHQYLLTMMLENNSPNRSIWVAMSGGMVGNAHQTVTDPNGYDFENADRDVTGVASTLFQIPSDAFTQATEITPGNPISVSIRFHSLEGKTPTFGRCNVQLEFLLGYNFNNGYGQCTQKSLTAVMDAEY